MHTRYPLSFYSSKSSIDIRKENPSEKTWTPHKRIKTTSFSSLALPRSISCSASSNPAKLIVGEDYEQNIRTHSFYSF